MKLTEQEEKQTLIKLLKEHAEQAEQIACYVDKYYPAGFYQINIKASAKRIREVIAEIEND